MQSHNSCNDAEVEGQRAWMALALAEPFFAEALFDYLDDVVFFVKDTQGRYLVVNRTLLRRCGFQEKRELLGRSPLQVFPAELGATYAAQDRAVIERGQLLHNRLELHLYANRASGWCLTQKIPLFDQEKRVIGLAGISRDLPVPNKDQPIYQRIANIIAHIRENYAEPLKLEQLARMATLSVAQLERYIQRIFGLTPKQLIIKTRIEAATQLMGGNSSIAAIAAACGYADHSAFSRQFKAIVGLSPTEYRELLRLGRV